MKRFDEWLEKDPANFIIALYGIGGVLGVVVIGVLAKLLY